MSRRLSPSRSARGMGSAVLAAAFLLAIVVVGEPAGAGDRVVSVKLAGADGGTEPRIAVGPDGRRWVVTNAGGREVVYSSADGLKWTRTRSDPKQLLATIDVDIVVTRTGRVIVSELDDVAVSFRTSYSDDGGATWKESRGTTLPDTDRQWLAVGPDDPVTRLPRVYLLFHNLFAGVVTHNVFAMTSTDNGATFGPPIPVTLPGSREWLDLQCGDSTGPSSLTVNMTTGRLYAKWGTRTSAVGGCGAQPPGVNVVGATRAWVATSPDNSLGSWTSSLAVDDSKTGQVVEMQFSPAAIDSDGTVYVVYPESPDSYPNYDGAAIKVTWAPPDLSRWSQPVTVVPAGGPGNILPHIAAGEPGMVDVAYLRGVARRDKSPAWFLTVAQSTNLFSGSPTFRTSYASSIPAYTGSASELMGVCGPGGPLAGLAQGLLCGRSTDVWGITLDDACLYSVTWPTVKNKAPGSNPGTFVATQIDGQSACATAKSSPANLSVDVLAKKVRNGAKLPATGATSGNEGLLLFAAAVGLACWLRFATHRDARRVPGERSRKPG